ncbi:hypothetical protein KCP70_11190 [Salmonella enterica subsp. enterica]|nr:hypothetical protein KCP70_11190 [Salmonella enterica subsp. enterica]
MVPDGHAAINAPYPVAACETKASDVRSGYCSPDRSADGLYDYPACCSTSPITITATIIKITLMINRLWAG